MCGKEEMDTENFPPVNSSHDVCTPVRIIYAVPESTVCSEVNYRLTI